MTRDDRDPEPAFPEFDPGEAFFFAQCPDPEREPCLARREVDGTTYLYFEDVHTMATLRFGLPLAMLYLQVVLVIGPDGLPVRMIRLERSIPFGTQMLCVLERDGRHLNFGIAERSDAERFFARAIELDRHLNEGRAPH